MGIIRLILALSVVSAHAGAIFGLNLVGGEVAVQLFFIISGFYMALILNEKYIGKGSYSLYISNRFLKLLPSYWFILCLSVSLPILVFLIFGKAPYTPTTNYREYLNSMDIGSVFFLLISNIFIIGQDLVMFLKLNLDGSFSFTSNFYTTNPKVYTFLFVPQAWSLSLEIMFYLIAPFIVRKKAWIVLLIILVSLFLRLYINSIGLDHDPWSYRFFPTEIAFFLMGVISYKLYFKLKGMNLNKTLINFIWVIITVYIIMYEFIPASALKQWLLYLMFASAIPLIFIRTKNNKLDRSLGELSYPVYISHLLVYYFLKMFNLQQEYYGLLTAILTIGLSMLIIKYLMNPIENYRQNKISVNLTRGTKNESLLSN